MFEIKSQNRPYYYLGDHLVFEDGCPVTVIGVCNTCCPWVDFRKSSLRTESFLAFLDAIIDPATRNVSPARYFGEPFLTLHYDYHCYIIRELECCFSRQNALFFFEDYKRQTGEPVMLSYHPHSKRWDSCVDWNDFVEECHVHSCGCYYHIVSPRIALSRNFSWFPATDRENRVWKAVYPHHNSKTTIDSASFLEKSRFIRNMLSITENKSYSLYIRRKLQEI